MSRLQTTGEAVADELSTIDESPMIDDRFLKEDLSSQRGPRAT